MRTASTRHPCTIAMFSIELLYGNIVARFPSRETHACSKPQAISSPRSGGGGGDGLDCMPRRAQ